MKSHQSDQTDRSAEVGMQNTKDVLLASRLPSSLPVPLVTLHSLCSLTHCPKYHYISHASRRGNKQL